MKLERTPGWQQRHTEAYLKSNGREGHFVDLCIPGVPEAGDYFGDGLTTGDLDGDGYTDLVVGVYGERIGNTDSSGVVTVIWGAVGIGHVALDRAET